jgi:anti-anti-sigma regulatory factor
MRLTVMAGNDGAPATTLALTGAVTIRHVDELKAALLAAFDGAGPILFDLAGVTDADPALFQLLASARLTVAVSQREFDVVIDPSKACTRAAVAAGFSEAVFFRQEGDTAAVKGENWK